tara:strand:- start:498 stop:845 length:348 start_codon:yes stop_codon:yes gene_type:complete
MSFIGSRYRNRQFYLNNGELYDKALKNRGIRQVSQFGTAILRYPSQEEINNLILIDHVWKYADSYAKLAFKYYGDTELWWVIGWFNKKPADFLLKPGDVITIPTPIEDILYYYAI